MHFPVQHAFVRGWIHGDFGPEWPVAAVLHSAIHSAGQKKSGEVVFSQARAKETLLFREPRGSLYICSQRWAIVTYSEKLKRRNPSSSTPPPTLTKQHVR